jgi:hypothetical protein
MVKVNLVGFKQFQDKFKKLPAELQKEIGAEIQFAGETFREKAIVDAPADVGFLRSQITKKKISDVACEVVSGSKYSAPMEFGTKSKFQPIPGIDASEFKGKPSGGSWLQFISNIKNWVKRKGLPANSAYLIARSIFKFGVKPHPFFFKQIAPVRRDLFRNVRNVLKTVTK